MWRVYSNSNCTASSKMRGWCKIQDLFKICLFMTKRPNVVFEHCANSSPNFLSFFISKHYFYKIIVDVYLESKSLTILRNLIWNWKISRKTREINASQKSPEFNELFVALIFIGIGRTSKRRSLTIWNRISNSLIKLRMA